MKYVLILFFLFSATSPAFGLASNVIQINKPVSMRLPVPTRENKPAKAFIISQGPQTRIRFTYEKVGIKPTKTDIVTTISWRRDLHSIKDIHNDIDKTDHKGVTTPDQSYFTQGAVFKKEVGDSTVVVFDLGVVWNGAAGSNRIVYILSPDGKYGALRLAPTGYLEFDWNDLEITW